jgi:hypothetical protein
MPRSAQRARLEARTDSLQLCLRRVDQFPDSLESRDPGRRLEFIGNRNTLH